MNIQQLIHAVEIHNCGSISKAAEKLFMAQPNLSSSLKALEAEIGVELFHRSSSGVAATAEGLEFVRYANEIIAPFYALEKFYARDEEQKIKINITSVRSSKITVRLIRFLNCMSRNGYALSVHFKEATNMDVFSDVLKRTADIGVIRATSSAFSYFENLARLKQCAMQTLPAAKYCILMSRNHPLADREITTETMLNPYTEIVHGDFETSWYPVSNTYNSCLNGSMEKSTIFTYDRGTLMDLVREVDGAYAWTTSTARSVREVHGLVEKHVTSADHPNMGEKVAIVYSATTPLSEKLTCLFHCLSMPQN